MRIAKISVVDHPPIDRFEIDDLSDRVVIAGPNGVGKTKLIEYIQQVARNPLDLSNIQMTVRSTNKQEEKAWGKQELDLEDPDDAQLLASTLQKNRFRRKLESSFVTFESDRSIQKINPLAFAFEMPDPEDEELSWDFSFQPMKNRYQDVVHSIFRMIETQRRSLGSRAQQLIRQGKNSMKLQASDPLEEFRKIFALLLPAKEFANPDLGRQRLRYTEDGETRDFETLSSGEREVLTVAFDFLLRKPRDCIILFDEPELHLHPELASRFLLTLQRIGDRNQFIFTTHSPDLVSASLDDTVVFLAASKQTKGADTPNQAILMVETDETNRALRLIGHSLGLVSLGRRIVLVEGENSSLDKLTYESIISTSNAKLVLIPVGGHQSISSFELVNREILSKSLWGVEFFMLVDGDTAGGTTSPSTSRLRRLKKYHLENYFLNGEIWASAFEKLEDEESWLRDPEKIEAKLLELAKEVVPYAVALRVANKVRENVGNVSIMPKDIHGANLGKLLDAFHKRLGIEGTRVSVELDESGILKLVESEFKMITKLLEDQDERWKDLMPGRPILTTFLGRAGLKLGSARRLYLEAARSADKSPFEEIEQIFDDFAVFSE